VTDAIEQARALPGARPDIFVVVAIAVEVSFVHRAELAIALEEEAADRVCLGCGCTDSRACPRGCSWPRPDVDLCSACVGDGLAIAGPCDQFYGGTHCIFCHWPRDKHGDNLHPIQRVADAMEIK
jgi:hypothetical protein